MLAKDLKKRGFSFVGPKTIYSFLQSIGIYNDHLSTCFLRDEKVLPLTTVTKNHHQLFLEAEPDEIVLARYIDKSLKFALYDEGELRGVMALLSKSDYIEVMNLAVHPSFQGQGYGRVLLEVAKKEAEKSGAKKLLIQTGTTTFDALKLYQRFGFRVTEVLPDYFTNHYKIPLFEKDILLKDALRLELIL